MRARVIFSPVLALITTFISGCAFDAKVMEDVGGFWPGLADGFLILFQFLSGHLDGPDYFERLRAGTSYYIGYLSGAMAFLTLGALVSRP